MKKEIQSSTYLDTSEGFWPLSCILGFLGIPGMILGAQLAQTYGIAIAIFSIFVGNLILWLIGFGIISMDKEKNHAIGNVKKQFGKMSALVAIVLFILAFLVWYTHQLSSAASKICQIFQMHEDWKVGLILGSIVAVLSSRGFKMVKWACIVGLPLLVGITLYYILNNNDPIQYTGTS